MATTKAKTTTAKKSATKPVVKKVAAVKKTPEKKLTPKKTTSVSMKTRNISAEERYKMIEVAAYYIAERNGFRGNTVDFWVAAETEVKKILGNSLLLK